MAEIKRTYSIGDPESIMPQIVDDGKSYNIFGEDGVEKTAKEFNKNFLGKIPINADVGKAADNGKPLIEDNPDHKISQIYLKLAEKIKLSFQ